MRGGREVRGGGGRGCWLLFSSNINSKRWDRVLEVLMEQKAMVMLQRSLSEYHIFHLIKLSQLLLLLSKYNSIDSTLVYTIYITYYKWCFPLPFNWIKGRKGTPSFSVEYKLNFQGIISRIYLSWWFHFSVGNNISQIVEKIKFWCKYTY